MTISLAIVSLTAAGLLLFLQIAKHAPRLYTGQDLSPEEQDVFDSLIKAAYEGDR